MSKNYFAAVTLKRSAAEPDYPTAYADSRSRRRARCPSGCRRNPSRCPGRSPWVIDELVEVFIGPGAALGLHGSREIKSATSLAPLVADDAVKIGTDAVRAALLEGMAGSAFLRRGRPFSTEAVCNSFSIGSDGAGAASLPPARPLPSRRFRSPAFPASWGENRAGGEARRQQDKAGGQNGTENFIEFEGVHFRSGSKPCSLNVDFRPAERPRMSLRN